MTRTASPHSPWVPGKSDGMRHSPSWLVGGKYQPRPFNPCTPPTLAIAPAAGLRGATSREFRSFSFWGLAHVQDGARAGEDPLQWHLLGLGHGNHPQAIPVRPGERTPRREPSSVLPSHSRGPVADDPLSRQGVGSGCPGHSSPVF